MLVCVCVCVWVCVNLTTFFWGSHFLFTLTLQLPMHLNSINFCRCLEVVIKDFLLKEVDDVFCFPLFLASKFFQAFMWRWAIFSRLTWGHMSTLCPKIASRTFAFHALFFLSHRISSCMYFLPKNVPWVVDLWDSCQSVRLLQIRIYIFVNSDHVFV